MSVVQLFTDTEATWKAMYEDCCRARHSIFFEQYLLKNDEIGNRFLSLFRRKAQEGVTVDLTLDFVGSRSVYLSPLIKDIRAIGGKVSFYNPLRWRNLFSPSTWLPRDHCKTMLIDSYITYVGGTCMAKRMKNWRDLHIRIQSEEMFSIINKAPAKLEGTGNFPFIYISDEPGTSPNPLYAALLDEIAGAQNHIDVVTPYFFPPRPLRQALKDAAGRGVKVRIIVSYKTDIPLAVYLGSSYFSEFRNSGVDILVYDAEVNHAKYVIVDDRWATVGSTNFDHLSLLRNREGNLIIRDTALIAQLKELFEGEAAKCRPARLEPTFMQRLLSPLIRFIRRKL